MANDDMTPSLDDLHQTLCIARRMLVDEMARAMDPEQVVPDIGHMRILAGVQSAIAAVEAVQREDQIANAERDDGPAKVKANTDGCS